MLVSFGAQPYQAEGVGIMGITRHDAIAIGDEYPLSFGAVGNVLHVGLAV